MIMCADSKNGHINPQNSVINVTLACTCVMEHALWNSLLIIFMLHIFDNETLWIVHIVNINLLFAFICLTQVSCECEFGAASL